MSPIQHPAVNVSERAIASGDASTCLSPLRLLTVERDGNPLRRFGHVSPHIGKLAPLNAAALRQIANLAASSLPPIAGPEGEGETLVIGTTESALLLAWFVAERLASYLDGGVELRFTTRETRKVRDGSLAHRTFLEPHSHGPVHSLALPAGVTYPRVVVVEDELTTGATLGNLLHEIRDLSPRHHVVTLSDARPEDSRERLRGEMRALGAELTVADLSLLEEGPIAPNGHPAPTHNPFSRSSGVFSAAVAGLRRRWLALRPECLYVIGECVDAGMALWSSLPPEDRPAFRHVTRSPWLVDGEAIKSRLDLRAPLVPRYFLYNADAEALPRRALLVGERSTLPVARRLARFLASRGVDTLSLEVPPG